MSKRLFFLHGLNTLIVRGLPTQDRSAVYRTFGWPRVGNPITLARDITGIE
jgi:hypothetical protein